MNEIPDRLQPAVSHPVSYGMLLIPFLMVIQLSVSVLRAELPGCSAVETKDSVVLQNGFLRIELNKKYGQIGSIQARVNGEFTLLTDAKTRSGLYLDWNAEPKILSDELKARKPRAGYGGPQIENIRITEAGPDVAEVAVQSRATDYFPFTVEYRYRMFRDQKLFYAWVRYKHDRGMPAGKIGQTRYVFRGVTGTSLFTHHVVDDQRKGPVNTSKVVETLQDSTTLREDGRVVTKYDNSAFTCDYLAHGLWGHGIGVWLLWPGTEFCNSGPMRQDLTVHDDNALLAMFQSGHYGAGSIDFDSDQEWSKLCGPVAFYVNEFAHVDDAFADAKAQAQREKKAWPYAWLKHEDYPLNRSGVKATVRLDHVAPVTPAWAILSPVEKIDWAQSANGYQYYARLQKDGSFHIDKIRPGRYKLNLSGADQPHDFEQTVDLPAGQTADLGTIDWKPMAHGRKLWQVGVFDRGSTEFLSGDNPRNYMRFMDYFKAFPKDTTFVIGRSKEKADWFYAQWSWYNVRPQRTIQFCANQAYTGNAVLTIGIASREYASGDIVKDVADRAKSPGTFIVKINGDPIAELTGAKTGAAGYRSASQDSLYVLEEITFNASRIKPGTNEVTFEHANSRPFPAGEKELKRDRRPNGSVMFDAIRLEVPF